MLTGLKKNCMVIGSVTRVAEPALFGRFWAFEIWASTLDSTFFSSLASKLY